MPATQRLPDGRTVCTHDPPLAHCPLCCLRGLVPCPAEGAPEPPPDRGPCPFLGGRTGERECETCAGRVRLKTFACAHPAHGPETDLGRCRTCPRLAVAPGG
jgi:hypothetical protein